MFPKRVFPLIAVLVSLIVPAALLAQETDVTFPVAVVAVEGSWDVGDDAWSCELRWETAGAPTLRVTGSNGARFRQDLQAGELTTVPEVGDAPSCVFHVEVDIAEARRYDLSIENAFLIEITSGDLDDLASTLILPVTMNADDEYGLATDDYLDIALGDDARPAAVQPDEPDTTQDEAAPAAPAGTPVSPELEGRLVQAEVQLFVFEDVMVMTDEGCRVDALDEDAVLHIDASTGRYQSRLTLSTGGVPVSAGESPMAATGCLFTFPLHLPAADIYVFSYQDDDLARVSFTEMEALSAPYLLAIDAAGNRTPERGIPLATPVMAEETASGSAVTVAGNHQIVGRLNLWTNGPESAPFGCAAGPYRSGIYPGAQVVVRNETGEIIASGELRHSDRSGSTVCAFDFVVTVPEARFYTLELGNGHTEVHSFESLELWNWRVFIDTAAP